MHTHFRGISQGLALRRRAETEKAPKPGLQEGKKKRGRVKLWAGRDWNPLLFFAPVQRLAGLLDLQLSRSHLPKFLFPTEAGATAPQTS